MNNVTLNNRTDINPYSYPLKPSTVWVLTFEDGSELHQYRTKSEAVGDAKKYNLTITN